MKYKAKQQIKGRRMKKIFFSFLLLPAPILWEADKPHLKFEVLKHWNDIVSKRSDCSSALNREEIRRGVFSNMNLDDLANLIVALPKKRTSLK